MKIEGNGNLCLWCFEDMGENTVCPHCGHSEEEMQAVTQGILPGTVIGGHYLVGRTLGQGGFGITYLVYDLDLRVKRAMKEFFPQMLVVRVNNSVRVSRRDNQAAFEKGVESFYREAQSVARLDNHPNIVKIHTIFRENGTAYFVMDGVEGVSFEQYLKDHGGKISWEEAQKILTPIGSALISLHQSHLLHRDVNPNNIMIRTNGSPVLLDFGAARYETNEQTLSSSAVVTAGYAPVEQYGSIVYQSTYTDVYALAATFYRAVSGIVPVLSTDRAIEDMLVPLNKLDKQVPERISKAVSHGMSIKSSERTPSVEAFLEEMGKPGGISKRKLLLILLAGVLAAAAGLILFRIRSGSQARPEKETLLASPCGTVDECYQAAKEGDAAALAYLQTSAEQGDEQSQAVLNRLESASQTVAPGAAAVPAETDIPTVAPSATAVPTETDIPTAAPSATAVPTETDIPTAVPSATAVPTETDIPTAVPSATVVPTETDIPTAAPSATAVPTETDIPTALPSVTAVSTQAASAAAATAVPIGSDEPSPCGSLEECYRSTKVGELNALIYISKLAGLGNSEAQYYLGRLCQYGEGIQKDVKTARSWYLKSAEQGNADAQNSLGVMYEEGIGTDKNLQEAMKWYMKAAEQGNADALEALVRLQK